MMLKKIVLKCNLTLLLFFSLVSSSFAVCPLCTVAVVAGLGLDRYLGVDDTISGIWIGGLLVSLIIWTIDWMNRKKLRFYGRKISITALYYAMVFYPLHEAHLIGNPLNLLWGIDKLVLGTILGSIFFLAGVIAYDIIKQRNKGRAYFPFQKIVMPITPLILLSVIFYFMT